jgi:hypothetical protein
LSGFFNALKITVQESPSLVDKGIRWGSGFRPKIAAVFVNRTSDIAARAVGVCGQIIAIAWVGRIGISPGKRDIDQGDQRRRLGLIHDAGGEGSRASYLIGNRIGPVPTSIVSRGRSYG